MEEPEEELLSHHFSHEHSLEHTNLPPKENTLCIGCNINIFPGKYYYMCETCPFFLHEVCYNMPRKIQHPSDPNHYFTLQVMPSSAEDFFKCKACGNYVNGFYYTCAKCGDYYHMLCSASPLSVKTPSHLHLLKLEFSPSYDFQCDLCEKPSYTGSGWLYRCNLCEFDAHLSCAISNKSVTQPNSFRIDKTIDSNNKFHELMELLTLGVKGLGERIGQEVLQDQSPIRDQLTPLSGYPATPSSQLSDACFSIEFAKSLLFDKNMGEVVGREFSYHEVDVPEVKGTSQGYTIVPKRIMIDSKKADQAANLASKPSFNFHNINSENGMKIASSTGIGSHVWMELGQRNERTKVNGIRDKSDVGDQTNTEKPYLPNRKKKSMFAALSITLSTGSVKLDALTEN